MERLLIRGGIMLAILVVWVIVAWFRRMRRDAEDRARLSRMMEREHRPAGGADEAGPEGRPDSDVRAAKLAASALIGGAGFEGACRALSESGMAAEDAETHVGLVTLVAMGCEENKNPDELLASLVAKGVPEGTAKAAMFGFMEALDEHREKEAWGDRPKRPPNAQEALARLEVLTFVIVHALTAPPKEIRDQLGGDSEASRRQFADLWDGLSQGNVAKMRELRLWDHASPKEQAFLQSSASRIDEQAHRDASWRIECLGVLRWALGFAEAWPKIDEETASEMVRRAAADGAGAGPGLPKLRPQVELAAKRDLMELWHWRVRTRQLVEERRPFPSNENMRKAGFKSYDDIVRFTAKAAHERGDLSEIIDEDFVFMGKPFRSLSAEEYANATSMIVERHYVLNWLCGLAPGNNWDETSTDT